MPADPRGTRQQRGYGVEHDRIRRSWEAKVARGQVFCSRCGGLILPGDPWDLGHDDHDRTRYAGPEHARCNRAAGGRKSRVKASRATAAAVGASAAVFDGVAWRGRDGFGNETWWSRQW